MQPVQEQKTNEKPPVMVARGSKNHLLTSSLVLAAVGIDHLLDETHGVLLVLPSEADRALFELEEYRLENQNWPEKPEPALPLQPANESPTFFMIGALILFFWVTGDWHQTSPWFSIGAIDSQKILTGGEWWRLVTALTLHADLVHLVGNCIIGGFMVHLLCTTTGYGMAWFMLLCTGALGNYINIAFRVTDHHSVGFSTSIFAAIGMFSGLQMLTKRKSIAGKLRQLLVPLGAGVALLAFLGVEGERTDLGAHFFGFGCGVLAGVLIRYCGLLTLADHHRFQQILFLATLAIFFISWQLGWNVVTRAPL